MCPSGHMLNPVETRFDCIDSAHNLEMCGRRNVSLVSSLAYGTIVASDRRHVQVGDSQEQPWNR